MLRNTYIYIFMVLLSSITIGYAQSEHEYPSQLSLEEAINYALENSHKAIDARKEVAKAMKQKWETTAQGLPQINADADYNYNIKQPVTLVPGEFMGGEPGSFMPLTFGTKQSASANITLTQMIFDGSYLVGLQAAKVFLDYTDNNAQKAAVEIETSITYSYASALLAQELTDIFEKNILHIEDNLQETKKIFENGMAEEESVEQLQITLLEMQTQLRSAKSNLSLAKQMLNLNIGIPINNELELTDSLDELTQEASQLGLLDREMELERTIDYQIAETLVKQRELEWKLERSKALPRLNAFINYGTSAYSDSFDFFKSEQSWYTASLVGVSLNLPIFSSGMRSAQTKKAQFALEQAENQLDEISQQLQINYNKQQNEYQVFLENLSAAKQNMELAERIEKKNSIKFQEGIGSSFDYRQAQIQLFSAQQQYFESMLNLIDSKAKLEALLKTIN